jgi:hypothetical protein
MIFFCGSVLGLSQNRGSTLVPSSHPNSSATRFATDLSFHEQQQAQFTSHRKMQRNIQQYPTIATNSNGIYPAGSKGSAHVSPCEMPLSCPALTLSVHPELGLQHSCDTPGLSTSDLAIHSVARLVQVPHHWTRKWNDWQHDLASNSLNFGWAKSTKELSLLQSIQ